jgi:hypothetical protein
VDIGEASWYDIDTMADLQIAETELIDPSFQKSCAAMRERVRVARRKASRSIPDSTRLGSGPASRLSSNQVEHV